MYSRVAFLKAVDLVESTVMAAQGPLYPVYKLFYSAALSKGCTKYQLNCRMPNIPSGVVQLGGEFWDKVSHVTMGIMWSVTTESFLGR